MNNVTIEIDKVDLKLLDRQLHTLCRLVTFARGLDLTDEEIEDMEGLESLVSELMYLGKYQEGTRTGRISCATPNKAYAEAMDKQIQIWEEE